MKINYDEVYQVELINELSARVYGRLLNICIKAGYDLDNTIIFECLLLQQIETMQQINLFEKNLKELAEIKAYWQSMNQLTKELLHEKVA